MSTKSFLTFRSLVLLFVAAATLSVLNAQKSPKESAIVVLGINEQIYSNGQYLVQVNTSVPSEGIVAPGILWEAYQPDSAGINTAVQSGNIMMQIYPGRLYTFITSSSGGMHTADIHFNVPPGYTMYMGQTNWPMTPRITCITPDFGGNAASWSTNFYVVPSDGASSLVAGYCTMPKISDVVWAISLGRLACGASAGTLRWQSQTLSTSLLDSSALNYVAPETTISATSSTYLPNAPVNGYYTPASIPDQIATFNDSNGNLIYIATNQIEIYIARNAGTNSGYTVNVYSAGTPFQLPSNPQTQPWTFQSSGLTDQYTISDPDSPGDGSTWAGRIRINKVQYSGQGNQTDTWTYSKPTSGPITLTQTSGTSSTVSKVVTITSTSGSGTRQEQYTIADGSGHIALQKIRNYQTYTWGEELTSEILDPTSMNSAGLNLTTTYTYYNTTWGDGQYSKLQSVTKPDGSWILYNYLTDFAHLGELASISTPWQDAPTTWSAATSSNCKVTTFNYTYEVYTGYQSSTPANSVYQTLSAGSQTSINGVTTAQETIAPSVWDHPSYTTPLFGNEPMRTDTISDYSSSGVVLTTVRTVFHDSSDPVYNGKLYSQVKPDGTKVSASYWKGTFNSYLSAGTTYSASSFVPGSTAAYWVANYLTGTSTQQDPNAVQYTNDGVNTNLAIDPVWMTPYRSYRRQTITDQYGNPAYDVNEVFTGSGFQIISWHQTSYTWDGLLGDDQYSTGTHTHRSYIDGHLNFQTNPDGTTTQYLFDALMRPVTEYHSVIATNSSYPTQVAVVTTNTFDAMDHVTSTSTQPSGGGLTLTTSSPYGLSGLQTSQTDTSGLTTGYSYTNGARTVTTTLPGGFTSISDRHLDGAPKSLTGNAQVNQFIAAVVNSNGSITTTTTLGTSGSSRYSTVSTDWLGRKISEIKPAFGGGSATTTYNYNSLGQLYYTSQTGMAIHRYQYDGLGELQYSSLDANGNGGNIDLAGPDRVTQTRSQIYVDANSVWWNQTVTSVANQNNSSNFVTTSTVLKRLLPYASNNTDYFNGVGITETDSYDYYGNKTVEIDNSNVQTGVETDTTTLPDSSTPMVKTMYGGRLMSSQTAQGQVTTYQYDGLGRQVGATDPRTGQSQTAYFTSGAGSIGRASTQTDAAGNSTSFTYASDTGRLASQTDALGDVTRYGYDEAGRTTKIFGSARDPVEYAFDVYGAQIAMRTFRSSSANFSGTTWPLSDDGSDPLEPNPASWTSGDITTWTFDGPTGLLTKKTDASGKFVTYTYNVLSLPVVRTWARGTTTTYSYDPNTSDLTGITYSDGTPNVTYTYDRLGHKLSAVQAYSGYSLSTGLQYNVPGKLTQEAFDSTYFSGRQLNYQLDSTGTGTLGRTIGFTIGTSSSQSSDQGVTFGFDSYGRFNSEGVVSGPTFTYNYQPSSNLVASITDIPDNWSQARGWEAHRDLLTSIQTTAGGTTQANFAYVYDTVARRSSKVSTGALFARYPQAGLTDIYSYDSMSEVTGDQTYQSVNASSPTTPMIGRKFSYLYDLIGNRTTSSIDSTYTTSYSANSLNQYSNIVVPGNYPVSGFSPNGSTITVNGTAVASGQIQGQYYLQNIGVANGSAPVWAAVTASSSLGGSIGTNTFVPQTPVGPTYDLDGNVLTDGRWNYTWDAENRLIAIETYGNKTGQSTAVWNSGVTRVHLDFAYDYLGRRIDKKVSNWNGSAWVPTNEIRYVYEKWNVVTQYVVSGGAMTFLDSFVWGLDISGKRYGASGVGGLLAMETASGLFELPIYDGNGNVMGLTDRSSSTITAAYEYTPSGQLLRSTGLYSGANPWLFSTRYYDQETHLSYYGYRYYSSELGRFINRDAIEEKGGINLYGFTANNPINAWDNLGNEWAIFSAIKKFLGFDVSAPGNAGTSGLPSFTITIGPSLSPEDPSFKDTAPQESYTLFDGTKMETNAGGQTGSYGGTLGVIFGVQPGIPQTQTYNCMPTATQQSIAGAGGNNPGNTEITQEVANAAGNPNKQWSGSKGSGMWPTVANQSPVDIANGTNPVSYKYDTTSDLQNSLNSIPTSVTGAWNNGDNGLHQVSISTDNSGLGGYDVFNPTGVVGMGGVQIISGSELQNGWTVQSPNGPVNFKILAPGTAFTVTKGGSTAKPNQN